MILSSRKRHLLQTVKRLRLSIVILLLSFDVIVNVSQILQSDAVRRYVDFDYCRFDGLKRRDIISEGVDVSFF